MVNAGQVIGAINAAANIGDAIGSITGSNASSSGKGPVRGARLEYDVPALGGRILLKEPFGFWFGLEPVYPEYGVFASGEYIEGKQFTKRAGFRFQTYVILLKPGTKVKVPKATSAQQRQGQTGTEERVLGNIGIGVSARVTVHQLIEFLKSNKQSQNINGLISPSLRKYQWGGVLHRAKKAGGGLSIPNIPSISGPDAGRIVDLINGLIPGD